MRSADESAASVKNIKALGLNKVREVVHRGHQPLPLTHVLVCGRPRRLVGGFILHGGVALRE